MKSRNKKGREIRAEKILRKMKKKLSNKPRDNEEFNRSDEEFNISDEEFNRSDEEFNRSDQVKNSPRKAKGKDVPVIPMKGAKRARRLQLIQANDEESKIINRLEKALGIKKKRGKKKKNENEETKKIIPSMFVEDGLDYVLNVLGNPNPSDEDEPDLLCSTISKCDEDESENNDSCASEMEEDLEDGGSSSDKESSEDDQKCDMDESGGVEDDSGSDGEEKSDVETPTKKNKSKGKAEIWEDIYGRLRDQKGNVLHSTAASSEYVPPQERLKEKAVGDEKKVQLERIARQMNGLINKLHEQNISPVSTQVEEMYMTYSRNDINEVLWSVLTKRILDPFETKLIVTTEHALLVARLHGNIGSEVGAYFLQNIAEKLDEIFKLGGNYGRGLQCDNLLNFLCHLYNLKVTHSKLIFDVLRRLGESFQDKDIELIHLMLKNVGFSLRKDDPLALKEVVLLVQKNATSLENKNMSRASVMLETLKAIRNNNMYKISEYDPSAIIRMQKVLRSLLRKGNTPQELDISMEDLLKASERGRWWIVGSAWSERSEPNTAGCSTQKAPNGEEMTEFSYSKDILELARKQNMNTALRKTIFCILVTAEDYKDAYAKLLRLSLKNQQETDVVSVLLHCSMQQKQYNPYYSALAAVICKSARKYFISFKCCFWDKFKELESMELHEKNNLALLLIHLFTTESLPISVLKVMQISDMNKISVKFFSQILKGILMHESDDMCKQIFGRISTDAKLKLFRQCLTVFMNVFILSKKDKMKPEEAEKITLRVKMAQSALNSRNTLFC